MENNEWNVEFHKNECISNILFYMYVIFYSCMLYIWFIRFITQATLLSASVTIYASHTPFPFQLSSGYQLI